MIPQCPSTNISLNNIPEPYEFIEDMYYEIKSKDVNFYKIENNNLVLYGKSSNYQTRPTHRVRGGVILENNNVIRGSVNKINEFNYILLDFTVNE
tara:strand:+ start:440 stop:724 length:285 start_codon:yes stop_codon:yes gene_type:complete